MPQESLWDSSLSWMKRVHGKSLKKDEKGTLKILLEHLDGLLDKVASILENKYVPFDLESIEEAGLIPLLIPDKFSYLLGSSYLLQSEVNEGLSSILKPTSFDRIESFEEDEDDFKEDFDDSFIDDSNYDEEEEEDGAYTCVKCSSTYDTYDDLVDHLETKCVREVKKSRKMKRGSEEEINERTCKICFRTFSSRKYLKYRHSHSHESSGDKHHQLEYSRLKCPTCQKDYVTLIHYNLHVKTCGVMETGLDKVDSRSLKLISCRKCGYIADSKEEFDPLNHKCEPNKRFKCSKCEFRTCYLGSLRNHDLAIHQKDKPNHCCEICGARYSYKLGFERHLKTHLDKPSELPCSECGELFSRRFALNRHMERCHKPAQQRPCEVCGKIFLTLRYLKRHIKSQHPESGELEKHECMHCHSFFREKAYLKKHIRRVHSGSKPLGNQ